ncbi:hypothetical protein L0B53_16165 [Vibrio sp. SS-MA-C1-2]|uniref:hypothetical protein n=1 Tax=Vibrio sp. SS-MA-C1-2 TaxID=2908646 RepID=UPI001F1A7BC1|nr:hypothetical protein [Vibrio sp. SS-MA-C1-2]UJF18535.1 hypothetical protein L0B53_16165 [Vibrio sp. SS-MA-C1-2]
MGKASSINKANRKDQSGGPYPPLKRTLSSLARMFNSINKKTLTTNQQEKFFITFIYLWFTGQLADLRKQNNSAKISDYTLPDIVRVRGYQPCGKNTIRTVMYGNIPWVEYGLAYTINKEVIYQWQPIPIQFNAFFQRFIAKKAYDTPLLTNKEREQLKQLIEKRWHYHGLNTLERSVLRKDVLIDYFNICAHNDNLLPAIARYIVIFKHDALHHPYARFYQSSTTEHIRAHIFHSHNDYIERLVVGIREFDWQNKFTYTRKNKTKDSSETLYFIDATSTPRIPAELAPSVKTIAQLHYQEHATQPDGAMPNLRVGSQRYTPVVDIKTFFQQICEQIDNKKSQVLSQTELIDYHNLCTLHLALTFILCTGTRPTHHISIERTRYFPNQHATVSDKGRYRHIMINTHLSRQIAHYQELQNTLIHTLSPVFNVNKCRVPKHVLWYFLDAKEGATYLSASVLRKYLKSQNASFVAYSLRHAFAQYALVSIDNKLTNSQVDHLMGHMRMGEDLGNDHLFPQHKTQLIHHLDALTVNFQLQEVHYAR